MSVLDDENVRRLVRLAWTESEPGAISAHEEGGFVLRDLRGMLTVERWPRGDGDRIVVPHHPSGTRDGLPILASFHTHPNPGPDYQQDPSLTDTRAVRDDPDLQSPVYEGEFVISSNLVYRIRKNGDVEIVGETVVVLNTK